MSFHTASRWSQRPPRLEFQRQRQNLSATFPFEFTFRWLWHNFGSFAIVHNMSKKYVILYVIICGILGFAGWHMHADAYDLASLSRMPTRNSSAPYDGDRRIAAALKFAKQEGKHVLIQSSAEGCTWCHVCHNLLTTNPQIEAKIKNDFVYVLVDTTNDQNRDFYKKYASATDHTLVLVVLDTNGKELTQSIGFDIVRPDPAHDGDYHITPEQVMSFLNEWSPKI